MLGGCACENQSEPIYLPSENGLPGNDGLPGNNGWSPIYAVETNGLNKVLKLVDYIGGTGTKPTANINSYVSTSGFTTDINLAENIGGVGSPGPAGSSGWTPDFIMVADGNRRVLRVNAWTGGTGTPPAVGYLSIGGGLSSDIASGFDLRGLQGLPGANGADSTVPGPTGPTGPAGPTGIVQRKYSYGGTEGVYVNGKRNFFVENTSFDPFIFKEFLISAYVSCKTVGLLTLQIRVGDTTDNNAATTVYHRNFYVAESVDSEKVLMTNLFTNKRYVFFIIDPLSTNTPVTGPAGLNLMQLN